MKDNLILLNDYAFLIDKEDDENPLSHKKITKNKKQVFCDIKSIYANDFYTSRMAGIKLEIKLLIDKYMYDNEKFILIDYKYQNNWQEYEIIRTYDRQDGFLELFLSLR